MENSPRSMRLSRLMQLRNSKNAEREKKSKDAEAGTAVDSSSRHLQVTGTEKSPLTRSLSDMQREKPKASLTPKALSDRRKSPTQSTTAAQQGVVRMPVKAMHGEKMSDDTNVHLQGAQPTTYSPRIVTSSPPASPSLNRSSSDPTESKSFSSDARTLMSKYAHLAPQTMAARSARPVNSTAQSRIQKSPLLARKMDEKAMQKSPDMLSPRRMDEKSTIQKSPLLTRKMEEKAANGGDSLSKFTSRTASLAPRTLALRNRSPSPSPGSRSAESQSSSTSPKTESPAQTDRRTPSPVSILKRSPSPTTRNASPVSTADLSTSGSSSPVTANSVVKENGRQSPQTSNGGIYTRRPESPSNKEVKESATHSPRESSARSHKRGSESPSRRHREKHKSKSTSPSQKSDSHSVKERTSPPEVQRKHSSSVNHTHETTVQSNLSDSGPRSPSQTNLYKNVDNCVPSGLKVSQKPEESQNYPNLSDSQINKLSKNLSQLADKLSPPLTRAEEKLEKHKRNAKNRLEEILKDLEKERSMSSGSHSKGKDKVSTETLPKNVYSHSKTPYSRHKKEDRNRYVLTRHKSFGHEKKDFSTDVSPYDKSLEEKSKAFMAALAAPLPVQMDNNAPLYKDDSSVKETMPTENSRKDIAPMEVVKKDVVTNLAQELKRTGSSSSKDDSEDSGYHTTNSMGESAEENKLSVESPTTESVESKVLLHPDAEETPVDEKEKYRKSSKPSKIKKKISQRRSWKRSSSTETTPIKEQDEESSDVLLSDATIDTPLNAESPLIDNQNQDVSKSSASEISQNDEGENKDKEEKEKPIQKSVDDSELYKRKTAKKPRRLERRKTMMCYRPANTLSSIVADAVDNDEGIVEIDEAGYTQLMTDMKSIKTLVLKLKRELQEAEVESPLAKSLTQMTKVASPQGRSKSPPPSSSAARERRGRGKLSRRNTMDPQMMIAMRMESMTRMGLVMEEKEENKASKTKKSETNSEPPPAVVEKTAPLKEKNEILLLKEEIEDYKEKLEEAVREQSSLRIEREELQHELDSKNYTIKMLQTQLEADESKEEMEFMKKQLKNLKNQVQQQRQEIYDLRDDNNDLMKELDDTRKQLAQAEKKANDGQDDRVPTQTL